jgi:hypothetical protein
MRFVFALLMLFVSAAAFAQSLPSPQVQTMPVAGTSGNTGPGFCPRTYEACCYMGGPDASTGTDGTITWKFVGAGFNDGKSGFSNATKVLPGAGQTWGGNSALDIETGVGPVPIFGWEFDTFNKNQNYPVGGPIMANLFLNGASEYTGTAAIYATLSGGTGSLGNKGFYHGALFQGDTYIQAATLADATSSQYVIHALGAPHVHDAVIRDDTNSARSIDIGGSHTIGIDMTRGTYGTAITLPPSNYIGLNGRANLVGYNGAVGALTYGATNSGTAYGFASYDNSDFAVGRHFRQGRATRRFQVAGRAGWSTPKRTTLTGP